jgi:signal transduction histidine kinase
MIDSAIIYLNKALVFADETKNSKMNKAYVYGSFGNIYYRQNNKTVSLEYFLKVKAIADEIKDQLLQENALISIAVLNRALFNLDEAIIYYEQAELIAEELKDTVALCDIYNGMANIFQDKKEYGKAIEYESKIIDISNAIGYVRSEALAKSGLARIYCIKEFQNLDKALEYANQAAFIFEEQGDPRLIAGIKELLARIYCKSGNYKQAEVLALKSLEIDSLEEGINKRNVLETLIAANIGLGNKDVAINYLAEYSRVIDAYNDESFHATLVEMETKYEAEKKEMRIASLEKSRKLYAGLGIALALAVVFAVLFILQRQKRNRKEMELSESKALTRGIMEGEKRERERLGNELHDSVQGSLLALKHSLTDSVADIDEVIHEVRQVASGLISKTLQLGGLRVALEEHCHRIPNVKFYFEGTDMRAPELIENFIYRTAQELITNSLKHANAKEIGVQLMQNAEHIDLTVHDNGKGYDPAKVSYGIGIRNIRNRVEALDGNLEIVSTAGKGTETYISVELPT